MAEMTKEAQGDAARRLPRDGGGDPGSVLPLDTAAAALAARLADPDPGVREASSDALVALTGLLPGALDLLRAGLERAEATARAATALAIGRGALTDETDRVVRTAHGDSDPEVRGAAASALALLRSGGSALVRMLATDPAPGPRNAAARALAVVPEPGAEDALVAALGDEPVRETALRSLDAMGWEPDTRTGRAVLALAERDFHTLVELRDVSVPLLGRALGDRNLDKPAVLLRATMVETLGRIGTAAAAGVVESALGDLGSPVRARATREMGRLAAFASDGCPGVLLTLLASDPDDATRVGAATALGMMRFAAGAGDLRAAAVDDRSPSVRLAASQALAQIGETSLLIAELRSTDPGIRRAAAESLGELRAEEAIDPLIGALGDAYATVRASVQAALEKIGWTPVGLKSSPDDPRYRRWVTRAEQEARAGITESDQSRLLARDLEAADPLVRQAALEAFALRKDPANAPAVVPALDDPHWLVRQTAAQTLRALGSVPQQGAPAAAWRVAAGDITGAGELGAEATMPLLRALAEHPAPARAEAARVLATIAADGPPEPHVVLALRAALLDDEAFVRTSAVFALSSLAGVECVPDLRPMLDDAHSVVRTAAGRTLVALGDPGMDALCEALEDSSSTAREAAGKALASGGGAAAPAAPLLRALLSSDADVGVRVAAAEALGGISGEHPPLLVAVGTDASWRVRRAAAVALGRTAPDGAVQALLRALGDGYREVREAAADALRAVGWQAADDVHEAMVRLAREDWRGLVDVGPAAVALLAQVIQSSGTDKVGVERCVNAIETLQAIGLANPDPERDAEALRPSLHSVAGSVLAAGALAAGCLALEVLGERLLELAQTEARDHVRMRAASALGRAGTREMVPALLEIAETDPSPHVRYAASYALAGPKIGEAALLIRQLDSPDAGVRLETAEKLGEIDAKEAIDPLIKTLGDAVASVRAAAYEALAKLGWTPVGIKRSAEDPRYTRWMTKAEQQARTGLSDEAGQSALLIQDLRADDAKVRQAALEALAARKDPATVEPIVPLLDDPHRLVRRTAAETLAWLGAVPAEGASAASWKVAMADFRGAVSLGDLAVGPVARALREHAPEERVPAATALGDLGGEAAVGALTRALGDAEAAVRRSAIAALGKAAGRSAATSLAPMLADPDEDVRRTVGQTLAAPEVDGLQELMAALDHEAGEAREAACIALALLEEGAAPATVRLVELLAGDGSAEVRIAAAGALGAIPGDHPMLLRVCTADSSWRARHAAVIAAGRTAPSGAAETLVRCLADSYREVREAAIDALRAVGWEANDDIATAMVCLAREDWRGLVEVGPASVDLLAHVIREPGSDAIAVERRLHAVETLEATGERFPDVARYTDVLRPALEDEAGPVLAAAARAAGRLDLVELGPRILELAETDPRDAVRVRAASALGRAGSREMIPALTEIACTDPSAKVRYAASEALAGPRIGEAALLISQLMAPESEVRLDAARRLGELRAEEAIDPLIQTLGDAVAAVRQAAYESLALLGWTPVGIKWSADDPRYSRWMTKAEQIQRSGLEAAAGQSALLEKDLLAPDARVRQAALEALAARKDPATVEHVVPLLDDSDWRVRRTAAEALQWLAAVPAEGPPAAAWRVAMCLFEEAAALGEAAVPPLCRALAEHLPPDRVAAAAALAGFDGEVVTGALRGALLDPEGAVRARAALSFAATAGAEGVEHLAPLVADPEADVRASAGRMLATLGERGVAALAAALAHEAPATRESAAMALGLAGAAAEPAAEPLSERLLGDADARVRIAAAEALGAIGGDRQALLQAAIDDRAWTVRAASVEAAGRAAPEGAAEVLVRCLADSVRDVREAAVAALEAVGWEPDTGVARAMLCLAGEDWQGLAEVGPAAVSLLARVLLEIDGDAIAVERRVKVILALEAIGLAHGDLGPEPLTDALGPSLSDASGAVLAAAALTAGRLALEGLGETLLRLAQTDSREKVRVRAASALGRAGNRTMIQALTEIAQVDTSPHVRYAAAEALAGPKIGEAALLIAQLVSPAPDVREAAAGKLGELRAREAIDPLIDALGDAVAGVRKAAFDSLGLLGWTPVGIKWSEDDPRYSRWMTKAEQLARTGLPDTADQSEVLARDLAAGDARVRQAALEALAARKDPATVEHVIPLLHDPDWRVRRTAAESLHWLGAVPEAGPLAGAWLVAMREWERARALGAPAEKALVRALGEQPPADRVAAADLLGALRGEEVVLALREALCDPEPAVRVNAAVSLGRAAEEDGVDALAPLLGDAERAVRKAAGETLATLGKAGIAALDAALDHARAQTRESAALALLTAGKAAAPASGHLEALLSADNEPDVRAAAAMALGAIPGRHATLFGAAIDDRYWQVRLAAVRAAGATAPKGASDVLVRCLADSVRDVREAAVEALALVGWKPDSQVATAMLCLAAEDFGGLVEVGPPAVELLSRVLLETDTDAIAVERREKVVEALEAIAERSRLAPARLCEVFRPALLDAAGPVLCAAARAAGRLELEGLGEALLELARTDPRERVRVRAAAALGRAGNRSMIQALTEIAETDPSPEVRYAAAEALAGPRIGEVALLVTKLGSPDASVRELAAKALGDVGLAQAIDPLIGALGDAVAGVRNAAHQSLWKLGWTPVGIKASPDDPKYLRWMTRGEQLSRAGLADADQTTLLAADLEAEDPRVRQAALEALAVRKDPATVARIMLLLNDRHWLVRRTCAETLRWLGAVPEEGAAAAAWRVAVADWNGAKALGPSAGPALCRALAEHPAPERADAAAALGEAGGHEAAAALERALGDEDARVRARASEALGRVAGGAAAGALAPLLDDPNAEVRTSAGRALAATAEGVSALTVALSYDSAAARVAAAAGLLCSGERGAPAAGELCRLLVSDPHTPARVAAAEALCAVPGDHAALLQAVIRDSSWRVRHAAVVAAGRTAPAGAADVLVRCLGDSYRIVREAAVDALSAVGWVPDSEIATAMLCLAAEDFAALVEVGLPAVSMLSRVLEEHGTDAIAVDRRVHAVEVLEEIGVRHPDPPRFAEVLRPALADSAGPVIAAAARAAGRQALSELGEDLLRLAEADPREPVRVRAASALGRAGNRTMIRALSDIAEGDPSQKVRYAASEALAGPQIGEAALLIAKLSAPEADVREQAARKLGELGAAEAIDPLIGTLGDAVSSVRTAAFGALCDLGWTPVGIRYSADDPRYSRWMTRAEQLERAGVEAGAQSDLLVADLRAEDSRVRQAALEALSARKDPATIGSILPLLDDPDWRVRRTAAESLGWLDAVPAGGGLAAAWRVAMGDFEGATRLGKDATVPMLRALAGQPATDRAIAAGLLGAFSGKDVVAGLEAALADEATPVRTAAAIGLGQAAKARGVPALAPLLADPQAAVRTAAGQTLAGLGKAGIEALDAALLHESAGARETAARCLGIPGNEAAAAGGHLSTLLLTDPAAPVRVAAAGALGSIGGERPALLSAAVEDRAWRVRLAAVQALGRAAPPGAAEALVRCLADSVRDVREAAVAALEAVGWQPDGAVAQAMLCLAAEDWDGLAAVGPAAVPLVSRVLLEDDTDTIAVERRQRAVEALEAIGVEHPNPPRFTEVLETALRDGTAPVLSAAARAAGRLGLTGLGDRLLELAESDPREPVRMRAALALGKAGSLTMLPALTAIAESDPSPQVRYAASCALAGPVIGNSALLVSKLSALDADVRRLAAVELGELGIQDAIDPLIARLGDAVSGVRAAAFTSLRQLGWTPVGVKASADDPKYSRWMTRAEQVERTGIPDGDQAALLAKDLEASDPRVRQAVLDAFAARKDEASVPLVVPLLFDPHWRVRRSAAEALRWLGHVPAEGAPAAAWRVAMGDAAGAAALGDVAREPLLRALREHSAEERAEAARALGGFAGGDVRAALEAALEDREPLVRVRAVLALGSSAGTEGVAALHPMLADADPAVRTAAGRTLAGLGVEGVLALEAALLHESPDARHAAALALQLCGEAGAPAEAGLEALLVSDGEPRVRIAAADALGAIPGTHGALLSAAIDDFSWEVREAAVGAIGQTSPEGGGETLLRCLGDAVKEVRDAAVAALDAIGFEPDGAVTAAMLALAAEDWDGLVAVGPAAMSVLSRVLEETDKDAIAVERRQHTVEVLEAIGDAHPGTPGMEAALGRALDDVAAPVLAAAARAAGRQALVGLGPRLLLLAQHGGRERVRVAALLALGHAGSKDMLEALVAIAEDDPSPNVRYAASEALAGPVIGDCALLIRRLSAAEAEIREQAAVKLGELSQKEAIDPLIATLGDAVPAVRTAAFDALRKIGWTPVGMRANPDDDRYMRWITRAEQLARTGVADADQLTLLLRDLEADDPRIRQAALEALAARKDRRAQGPVSRLLEDPVWQVRRTAAESLQWLSAVPDAGREAGFWLAAMSEWDGARSLGADAKPALLRDLVERPAAARAECARVLGLLGGKDASDGLLTSLRDADGAVRRNAVVALAQSAKAKAAPALVPLLADTEPAVRAAASETLAGLGKAGVEGLSATLDHPLWEAREAAARGLLLCGKQAAAAAAALEGLLAADAQTPVRVAAAEALGGIPGDHPALLYAAIHDGSWRVRHAAVVSSGRTSPEGAAEVLVQCLADGVKLVREAAVASLSAVGWKADSDVAAAMICLAREDFAGLVEVGPASVPLLARVLLEEGADTIAVERRTRAVEALEGIGERHPDVLRFSEALRPALHDVGGEVLAAAARAAGRLALAPLGERLLALASSDPRERVRVRAAAALGRAGNPGMVDALVAIAEGDASPEVRYAAAEALSGEAIGDSELLIRQLSSPVADLREQAAVRLGELEVTEAIDPLIGLLYDAYATVRAAAIEALSRIGWTPVGVKRSPEDPRYSRWMTRAEQIARTGMGSDADQSELLAKDLMADDARIRQAALEALAGRKDPGTVEIVIPLLDDPHRLVRRTAAESLQWMGAVPVEGPAAAAWKVAMGDLQGAAMQGEAAKPALLRALREHPERDRAEAARVLALLGGEDLTAPLVAALADPEAFVRTNAVLALGVVAGPVGVPWLSGTLSDEHSVVRVASARTLATLGEGGAAALAAALSHASAGAREAAARGLTALGPAAAPAAGALEALLVDDEHVPVREASAEALGAMGGEHPPLLLSVVHDGSWRVRLAAAMAIGRLGHPQSADVLVRCLGDSYRAVREAVVEALRAVGWQATDDIAAAMVCLAQEDWAGLVDVGPASVGLLARVLLEDGADALSVERRVRAVETMEAIGERHPDPDLFAVDLAPALEDVSGPVRAAAARAAGRLWLVGLGHGLLRNAEHDPDDKARMRAASALARAGNASMAETLIRIAEEDRHASVRYAAAEALAGPAIGDAALLIRQLRSPDAEHRQEAAAKLGELQCREAIDPLIEALGDAVAGVRAAAFAALQQIGWTPVGVKRSPEDPRYSRWMTKAEQEARSGEKDLDQRTLLARDLQADDPRIRQASLEALALRRDPETVALALPLLDDVHRLVRRTAAETLQSLGGVPQEGSLAAAWRVATGDLQGAALLGEASKRALLRALREHPANDRAEAARTLALIGGQDVAEALEAALFDEESYVRTNAVLAYGVTAGAKGVEALSVCLADEHSVVRAAAGRALSTLGKEGLQALVAGLSHESAEAREASASALVQVGRKAAKAASARLGELCRDPSVPVRVAAARALGAMGGEHPVLLEAVVQDESWRVRQAAAAAIGRTSPAGADRILVQCLGDSVRAVREEVVKALESVGWRPDDDVGRAMLALAREDWPGLVEVGPASVDLLARVLREKDADKIAVERRVRAVEALEAIGVGHPDAARLTDALRPALGDVGGPVRAAAGKACGVQGLAALGEVLLRLAETDPVDRVRVCAAAALGRAGNKTMVDRLTAISKGDRSPSVQYAACEALAGPAIGNATLLVAALSSPEEEVRAAAAKKLGELDVKQAIDPLIGTLGDAVAGVRAAARASLELLGWVPVGVKGDANEAGFRRWLTKAEVQARVQRGSGEAGAAGEVVEEPGDGQASLLLLALGDVDAAVRRAALEALAARKDPTVAGAIVPLLDDPELAVRQEAGAALRDLGAVPMEGAAAAAALVALGRMADAARLGQAEGSAVAAPSLVRAARENDAVERLAAVRALGQLDPEQVPAIVPAAQAALLDPDAGVRREAVVGCAKLQGAGSIEALEPLLGDADESTRRTVAAALLGVPEGKGVSALLRALRDERALARAAALEALGTLGTGPGAGGEAPAEASGNLMGKVVAGVTMCVTADPDARVRATAVETLVRVAGAKAFGELGERLRRDESHLVRQAAAAGLGATGHKSAPSLLVEALGDPYGEVRDAALAALDRVGFVPGDGITKAIIALVRQDWKVVEAVGEEAVPLLGRALLSRETDPASQLERAQAVACLSRIGGDAAKATVPTAFGDPSGKVRAAAADAAVRLRLSPVVAAEPLVHMLESDPDFRARARAASALGSLGVADAAPALARAASQDDDPGVRSAAAIALAGPGIGKLERLIAQLGDQEAEVRRAAAMELGRLGNPRSIDPLVSALSDAYAAVRTAAKESLYALCWVPFGLRRTPEAKGYDRWVLRQELSPPDPGTPQLTVLAAGADHPEPMMRYAVAEAFALLGDPKARRILEHMAQDKDAAVAAKTREVLAALEAPPREPGAEG